jgi:hypothetical protein
MLQIVGAIPPLPLDVLMPWRFNKHREESLKTKMNAVQIRPSLLGTMIEGIMESVIDIYQRDGCV